MGASSSKAARSAASSSTRRKYPSRTPESNPTTNNTPSAPAGQPTAPGPTVHPQSQASNSRDEYPDFARSLRTLGPVHPASTLSNSSTFPSSSPTSDSPPQPTNNNPQLFPNHLLNPALQILSRRAEIAAEADAEFTRLRGGGEGRRFLDVGSIREVLAMRDGRGMREGEIEGLLGLRRGVVGRLGQRGVVGEAGLGAEKDGGWL
ncbi:MAG: hypothetical protein LQ339_000465 [Xanthoria mediterranea]|nr:MAG: hypothetical protein LQ339_000465 [Xanthoria mediterranea]